MFWKTRLLPFMLDFIEHVSLHAQPPQFSIIWLHGLGANGNDFMPIADALALPVPVRFIFPHAPVMPVTINNGYMMRAWYDIYSLEMGARQDETGIRHSQSEIESFITQEKARGIASHRIMLAGFSQGGAIALQTALRHPQRLAGVLALSTYLPLSATLPDERNEINCQLPVFMAHGKYDNVITYAIASNSRNKLQQSGYAVEWHEYEMAHSVCDEELADIRKYILHCFDV